MEIKGTKYFVLFVYWENNISKAFFYFSLANYFNYASIMIAKLSVSNSNINC